MWRVSKKRAGNKTKEWINRESLRNERKGLSDSIAWERTTKDEVRSTIKEAY